MKIIFLDRDGVINKDPAGWTEHSYITECEDFHFLPGSLEAIKKLTDAGYEIAIISNQAGIAKGYYTFDRLNEITELMLESIKKHGGRIRSIHYCPHRNEDNCDCRKPKLSLFKEAIKNETLDIGSTYFIGDGVMDVEAGKKMGLKTVLVLSGKTELKDVDSWKIKPDFIKKDLKDTVSCLLGGEMQ